MLTSSVLQLHQHSGYALSRQETVATKTLILDRLMQWAERDPHRLAIQDHLTALSYGLLHEAVVKLSEQLQDYRGQVVGLFQDNSLAWAIADLACMRAGVTLVPLPLFFSPDQLVHAIYDSGMAAVLSQEVGGAEKLLYAADINVVAKIGWKLPMIDPLFYILDIASGRVLPDVPAGTAKITYTSGTTGTPKGVCLSSQSIDTVANALAIASQASSMDHHVCVLPLSTLLENIAGLYVPLIAGASVTILSLKDVGLVGAAGFDQERLLHTLDRSHATTTVLTPELLYGLVVTLEVTGRKLTHLRFAAVGGASVSPQLLSRAKAVGMQVFEGYGLSECTSVVALNTPHKHRVGSVGKPLPHVRLEIAEDGEIIVHSAVMLGYLGSEPFLGRGIHTGDRGYLDGDGYLYITGRKKNIFITSFGRNVSPEWVERELNLSPVILQSALFGEARPWNVAVLVTPEWVADEAIQADVDAVNQSLPDYARITKWIKADAPFLPTNGQATANGRLRRDVILNIYQERINRLY